MNHAIRILREVMEENREACSDLSNDGDCIGSERAGYIADDCYKALRKLGYDHSQEGVSFSIDGQGTEQ